MVAFYHKERTMFRINDAVAVLHRLPYGCQVMAISKIKQISEMLIETFDHRCFSVADGVSLNGRLPTHIELATPTHLLALRQHRLIR